MSRQTGMRDPFPIVCALGDRFQREKSGLMYAKAIVMLAAHSGPPEQAWPIAQELAEALGFNEDYIERMFYEAYTPQTTTLPGESGPPARGVRL